MMAEAVLGAALAQGWASGDARREQGREVYEVACAACHGADGRGNPAWESKVAPPDLADCATTAERADHWEAIVARGGAKFGLSSVMPSFEETLTQGEITAVVAYSRTLCVEADRYPPGELNPRRLLSTPKAFPESEVRVEASHALDGSSRSLLHVELEGRLGPGFQYGVGLPIRPWDSIYDDFAGLGNVELELKRVLGFSPSKGLIAALGLAVEAPTGSRPSNLSSGTWVWKPLFALSKSSGRTSLQAHVAAELPSASHRQDRQLVYGFGLSRALGPPRSAWTPACELAGVINRRRHFRQHELLFEVSRPLSRLGHVVAAVGVRIPIGRYVAPARLEGYVLWDFSEGPPWRGF